MPTMTYNPNLRNFRSTSIDRLPLDNKEGTPSRFAQILHLYFILLIFFLLFVGGHITRPFFSAILAVFPILIVFILEIRYLPSELYDKNGLRICFASASLPSILFVAGLGRFNDSRAFVVLNMVAFSTSFTSLFLSHRRRPEIRSKLFQALCRFIPSRCMPLGCFLKKLSLNRFFYCI